MDGFREVQDEHRLVQTAVSLRAGYLEEATRITVQAETDRISSLTPPSLPPGR